MPPVSLYSLAVNKNLDVFRLAPSGHLSPVVVATGRAEADLSEASCLR